MLKREDIERFYREVETLNLKFPVAEIARQTGHSKANVSKYLSRKLEPSEAFLTAFNEKFHKNGRIVSRETSISDSEAIYGHEKNDKQKIIELLERENLRLTRDLEISLSEIRQNVLLARSIAEVTQDLLIELVERKRKLADGSLGAEVGKANFERYKRLKEEGNFPYTDK